MDAGLLNLWEDWVWDLGLWACGKKLEEVGEGFADVCDS